MQVTTNVPGKNSNSNAKATDFVSIRQSFCWSSLINIKPLVAKVAADQTCTGEAAGMAGVCMVRCNNAARAGPFGGCVTVQMVGAATAAGNATAATKRSLRFNA